MLERPQFILASRLQPVPPAKLPENPPGVQQVVILGTVSRAAVLCNNHLTFYSLPELSPIAKPLKDVAWIGVDQSDLFLRGLASDGDTGEERDPRGAVLFMGQKKHIRMLRIGAEVRLIKV